MSEPEDGPQDTLIALKARADALEEQLRQVEANAARRLREAELQAEATRAGIIDIDGLRLINPEAMVPTPGRDFDPADVVSQLRRDKPWLFTAASSSSTRATPMTTPTRTRLAMEMSVEEWRAARAALLQRR